MNALLDQKELGLFAVQLNNADLLVLARQVARGLSAKYGSVSIDQVRTDPRLQGHTPSSSHFWGSVFMEKGFRVVDETRSTVPRNHGRRVYKWEWKP